MFLLGVTTQEKLLLYKTNEFLFIIYSLQHI